MQIGEIANNSRGIIRVTVSEYEGHRFIDLRIYLKDALGEYHPSREGVTLSEKTIRGIIDFLKEGSEMI
ncbi:MAG: transcriptional coactivator p15 [Candidatus Marinimicrobia bacterium]|nr:transcriptional coactivator p15 [Candidatus Neomarinimicrobiota bacterium]